MNDDKSNRLIWIDLETTGLDPETCAIIEIAVFVTTGDLCEVAEPIFRHCYPQHGFLDTMDEVARAMHEASGLLSDSRIGLHDGRGTLRGTEDVVLAFLQEHTEPGACPLAGSSVHFDRAFLARWMPRVHAHLGYRNFDVSTFLEAARRWTPELLEGAPKKRNLHRALPDLEDSLRLARYFRWAMINGETAVDEMSRQAFAFRESML